eukprot:GHVQ01005512.1.p1 GENE.GHVQ01005512.1~~GHVQ01005512.1.p1  ORF type:complete len:680 (-),score=101.65 GHVQ01005512.1:659-2698(-)
MPSSPSSHCPTLTPIEHKWVDRLLDVDYNQHHLLHLLLNQSVEPSDMFPTDPISSSNHKETVVALLPKLDSKTFSPLVGQLEQLDDSYTGGLVGYLNTARRLLKDSRLGANPLEGYRATVPEGEHLEADSDRFVAMEDVGVKELGKLAFVLVAGGLGERLGYPDIKIGLPVDLVTQTTYIELYAQYILAYERTAEKHNDEEGREKKGNVMMLPLAIMTSEDTHSRTVELFEMNGYFGLKKEQVTFMKQGKVAALADGEGRIAARRIEGGVEIEMKPHGHGDVHSLLLKHGLTERWIGEGRRWVVFFQDTNALTFRGLPAALGVSVTREFAMNSVTVPRKPGEAVGAICMLQKECDGSSLTLNIEYNVLEPLLRSHGGKGDEADPMTGNSRYPGNINNLIVHLPPYHKLLQDSKGAMPEFVNPKYTDESRTTFRSNSRLECMMQDLPRMFSPKDIVGFTQMNRWQCFSAVKNCIDEAAKKTLSGSPGECAFSAEMDYYFNNKRQLEMAFNLLNGGDDGESGESSMIDVGSSGGNIQTFKGVSCQCPPLVVLLPSWGITRRQMCRHLTKGCKLVFSDRSTFVVEGNADLAGLELDGSLHLKANEPGTKLLVRDLQVKNDGCAFEEVPSNNCAPALQIRGYSLIRKCTKVVSTKSEDRGMRVRVSGVMEGDNSGGEVSREKM